MFRLSLWLGDSHQFDVKCNTAAQAIRLGRLWCKTDQPKPWWMASKPRRSRFNLAMFGDSSYTRLLTSITRGWQEVTV